jgi:predicted  nucleic acid-binding Zn-ribbon protein
MISDELGMQLHDRWTRGQRLTAGERTQLEEWYQQQDALEDQQLNQVFTTAGIPGLQAEVEMTLTQLGAVIQRIQQVMAENEGLRQEISALRQQLTAPKSA